MTRNQLFAFFEDRKILTFTLAFIALGGTGFGFGYVAHFLADTLFNLGFAAGYALASLLA
jgi:hypothetical protein